jgi:hypothetical protein
MLYNLSEKPKLKQNDSGSPASQLKCQSKVESAWLELQADSYKLSCQRTGTRRGPFSPKLPPPGGGGGKHKDSRTNRIRRVKPPSANPSPRGRGLRTPSPWRGEGRGGGEHKDPRTNRIRRVKPPSPNPSPQGRGTKRNPYCRGTRTETSISYSQSGIKGKLTRAPSPLEGGGLGWG